MNYKALADAVALYPDVDAAIIALPTVTNTVDLPRDKRMINERTVFALIGMTSGEAFMTALEGDVTIPNRVKVWFKPSELGVDVLDVSSQLIIAGMVSGGVITQEQGDTISSYGREDILTWPNVNTGHIVKAMDMRNRGEI